MSLVTWKTAQQPREQGLTPHRRQRAKPPVPHLFLVSVLKSATLTIKLSFIYYQLKKEKNPLN